MSTAPKLFDPRPDRQRRAPGAAAHEPPRPGDLLTTGRICWLLKVSPPTVRNWIDSGALRAFRLPPLLQDRRVHEADLVEFMLGYGMFRKLAEGVVADDGVLCRVHLHDRWGRKVARVAGRDAPQGAGTDWLPFEETRYVLKSATPEAFRALVDAGFRFEDGR